MRTLPDDPEDFRASLIDHLEEFRQRLFRVLSFLIVGWIVGWLIEPNLYAYLDRMVTATVVGVLPKSVEFKTVFSNAMEAFMLKLQLSFIIGLVLVFPVILYQLWGFVAPALSASERKPIKRIAPLSGFLFVMGVSFCWIILPKAIGWFASYVSDFPGTSLFQHAGVMIFFSLKMLLAFGLGFQLPLAVWLLGALGLYKSDVLVKRWREGATAIFVLAAIVTPSNDFFSMLMMAIPLTLLFLISIWALQLTEKRKEKARLKAEKLLAESEATA